MALEQLNNSSLGLPSDIVTTSIVALNGDLITGDYSQYQSLLINITGVFVATWTVQFCNDPTFTNNVTIGQVVLIGSNTVISGTSIGPLGFTLPMQQGKYVRIRATSYTSGTITGIVSGSQINTSLSISSSSNTIFPSSTLSVTSTITLGNTAQVLISTNLNRKALEIQNNSSSDLRVSFGGVASSTVGFIIKPDSGYNSSTAIYTGTISIFGTTTGQQYTYWEAQ